jgi:hypothetical protein
MAGDQPAASVTTSWLRDALGAARSPRARRAARAVTFAAAAYEVGKKLHREARSRVEFTVVVPGLDEAFDLVSDWLTERIPSRSRRSLSVTTRRRRGSDSPEIASWDGAETPKPPSMRVAYDGSRAQTVRIGGHRVSVKVDRAGRTEGMNLSVNTGSDSSWERSLQQITFTCYGADARDAVLALVDELTTAALSGPERRPRMSIARRWGDWQRIRDVPLRELSTVILADGQSERIVADLERFLAAETLYGRVGIPWHRGFLFHGPPGCGKTSFATALAGRFGFDVYLLPLSDLDADVNLVTLLGMVDARSVLIIEDVDVAHAAASRDDDRKGVTLSGLLNALDGLVTPHGLVTVMTTNQVEDLDPALVRPGRADLSEWFGPLDQDQADRLAGLVRDDDGPFPLPGVGEAWLTHAELLEAAKPYLDDVRGAATRSMIERVARAREDAPLEAIEVDA